MSRSPARSSRGRPSCSPTSPPGNLDSKSSAEVLQLLRNAVDEFGQTVVMVTHDAEAASVGDRLVVLRDGRICHDAASGRETRCTS